MNGSTEKHTAYIYGAKSAKAHRQLQLDFPRESPVKKPSASPVKEKSLETIAKAATPLKLKLRGARLAAAKTVPLSTDSSSSSKSTAPPSRPVKSPVKKKSSNLLAKLQTGDYSLWVNNTGVIGGDSGKRPQRTRKQVDLKKM